MNVRAIFVGAALALVWVLSCVGSLAEQPTTVRHYRFLPRHSTLTLSRSWLEAPDVPLRVFGTFDLAFSPAVGESWGQLAQFENVRAWAFNPLSAAPPLSLDAALNLSGLKGRQLPVLAPFDVFQFEGQTADGSAVNLFADVIGSWLNLNGGTTPPLDGKHHPIYELRSQARELPFADFNDDGLVSGEDLAQWTRGFGATAGDGADAADLGDADGDLVVDGSDFLAWQRQLGEGSALGHAASAVPEPDSILLLLAAGAVLTARRRTRSWRRTMSVRYA
jgi:hypothetical protein